MNTGPRSPSGLVVVVFFALIQSTAYAQGTLYGVVKNAGGDVGLPGVTVEVDSKALQRNLIAFTDSEGAFAIAKLPPGTYNLTFTLAYFDIPSLKGIRINGPEMTVTTVSAWDNGCERARGIATCVTYQQVAEDVPQAFRPLWLWSGIRDVDAFRRQYPCESISLTTGGGLQFVPRYNYSVVFFREGRAELKAQENPDKDIDYISEVPLWDYGKLCYLAQRLGIDRLARLYTKKATDGTGFTVAVKFAEREVVVTDYFGSGPIELWAVAKAIEAVKNGIDWKARN